MGRLIFIIIGLAWFALIALLWRRRRSAPNERRLHWDVAAGGILFLLQAGFFWRTLTGDVFQPADGGDLVSFLYPTYRFAAAQIAQGVLPLWNPTLYAGAPFIADIQAGFLYLPNLLLFLSRPNFPYIALQGMVFGHLYGCGLGMYVLLRTVRWANSPTAQPVSRPAALFAALAFSLSDPFMIHLGNLNLIAVLSWLPWIVAAFYRAIHAPSLPAGLRWAAAAGLLFALANYAGHAQSSYYLAFALVILAAGWSLVRALQRRSLRISAREAALRPVGMLVVTLVLIGLLSAPILLPAAQLTQYTERSGFTYQDTTAFSLAPAQAIGLITPGFFGRGPALHWSLWDRVETPYVGVATLLLAIAALTLAWPSLRRQLWPWAALALFGFVLALGVYTLVHGWLTLLVPGFAQFRAPARGLVLWSFGVSALAAIGLDRVTDAAGNARLDARLAALARFWRYGLFALGGILLPLCYLALLLTQESDVIFLRASVATLAVIFAAGFWAASGALTMGLRAGWWSPVVFQVLAVALLVIDLGAASAYTDISPDDPTVGFHHPEIVAFLRQEPGLFRIDTRTDIEGIWQPDAAALHGLQDVGGIANPLMLADWRRLWEATGGRQTELYDMLNVRFVIARDDTPLPEGKFELALDAPGALSVYRNRTAMPRAWIVHNTIHQDNPDAALAELQSADFDPGETVILPSQDALPVTGSGESAASVTHYGANRIVVEVETSAPGYLVLSELWYPGWQATVNGESATVLPANGALRAVYVPAGASTVELRFALLAWRAGLAMGGIGLMLLVGVWVWSVRRRLDRDEAPPE